MAAVLAIGMPTTQAGLTLVEMICVLVLLGILGAAGAMLTTNTSSHRLQAARDRIVWSFSSAQLKAMRQAKAIQVSTSGSTLDVREDTNNDGTFASSESISLAGVQYPMTLDTNQTVTSGTFLFDRFGRTASGTVTLSNGAASVVINVSSTGFVR